MWAVSSHWNKTKLFKTRSKLSHFRIPNVTISAIFHRNNKKQTSTLNHRTCGQPQNRQISIEAKVNFSSTFPSSISTALLQIFHSGNNKITLKVERRQNVISFALSHKRAPFRNIQRICVPFLFSSRLKYAFGRCWKTSWIRGGNRSRKRENNVLVHVLASIRYIMSIVRSN